MHKFSGSLRNGPYTPLPGTSLCKTWECGKNSQVCGISEPLVGQWESCSAVDLASEPAREQLRLSCGQNGPWLSILPREPVMRDQGDG